MIEEIVKQLKSIFRRLEALETQNKINNLTMPADSVLVVPVFATDPTSPTDGQLWYDSTSNVFKCRENGTTKTFTTT